LVEAIQQLAQKDQAPILVVAPSNAAVDLLSEKLSLAGLNVLRVGNPARVSDALMTLTLDAKMTEHPAIKEIKRFKKQAQEFKIWHINTSVILAKLSVTNANCYLRRRIKS
jgi:superfamily I DNA and/or RNA helicase